MVHFSGAWNWQKSYERNWFSKLHFHEFINVIFRLRCIMFMQLNLFIFYILESLIKGAVKIKTLWLEIISEILSLRSFKLWVLISKVIELWTPCLRLLIKRLQHIKVKIAKLSETRAVNGFLMPLYFILIF